MYDWRTLSNIPPVVFILSTATAIHTKRHYDSYTNAFMCPPSLVSLDLVSMNAKPQVCNVKIIGGTCGFHPVSDRG